MTHSLNLYLLPSPKTVNSGIAILYWLMNQFGLSALVSAHLLSKPNKYLPGWETDSKKTLTTQTKCESFTEAAPTARTQVTTWKSDPWMVFWSVEPLSNLNLRRWCESVTSQTDMWGYCELIRLIFWRWLCLQLCGPWQYICLPENPGPLFILCRSDQLSPISCRRRPWGWSPDCCHWISHALRVDYGPATSMDIFISYTLSITGQF